MVCQHPVKLRATNVRAPIVKGAFSRQGEALNYDEVVFCSHPCCERVFKAVRTK